ncbi:sensor histidine kinase [Intrasporangium calvum]|uniref:histidine kinase n=1 Tax=Intrasporangium calvum TaxID=53358 RepID=A0ABT5GDG1_9MICO|nr:sensor histidine kinase [Intrasporangium calvum]MDC5695716.1 sensor histidine kinase [Intrasporangium calvum]
MAFAIALEIVRYVLEHRGYWTPSTLGNWHLATVLLVILGIVVFSLTMFWLIDRAERQVIRQNRDLATANAVAAAIQGQSTVSSIVDGSLAALVGTGGTAQARIRLFQPADLPEEDATAHTVVAPGLAASTDNPSVDVPLTHGPTTVGRLSVWYDEETYLGDRVGTTALSSLTTQIACAIQLAEAVGDLNRRKIEGHALYDILLRVSNQEPTTAVLDTVARHAVTLLRADGAAITVFPDIARSVRFEAGPDAPTLEPNGSAVVARGAARQTWSHTAARQGDGATGPVCQIEVGRSDAGPFTERDCGFLSTLASLIGIALTGAQMRELSRQRAILSERTRIAREMHDSLAQVLGAVHLRLRALGATFANLPKDQVGAEVDSLAEVCAESYRDVRETILGLRDSQQHADRSLEDNLRAYLMKYSSQSGIAATLVNEVGHEVSLSPRAEVHLIRVVQEALTNVRKHAAASSVTVSVSGTDASTTFEIEDDGVGFDHTSTVGAQDGYGLFTMRDRAALLGGTVDIDSVLGRGTRIMVTVPERPFAPRVLGGVR